MRLAMAAFGVATLVGVGYVIGKKVFEKKAEDEDFGDIDDMDFEEQDEEEESIVYAKQSYSDKLRKGAMFAVGAIKTGADKFGETIKEIQSKDMVKKGEETMEAVKETGENIKNDIKKDIEDLKSMVSSIGDDDSAASAEDLFEETPDTAEENIFEESGSDEFGN